MHSLCITKNIKKYGIEGQEISNKCFIRLDESSHTIEGQELIDYQAEHFL